MFNIVGIFYEYDPFDQTILTKWFPYTRTNKSRNIIMTEII